MKKTLQYFVFIIGITSFFSSKAQDEFMVFGTIKIQGDRPDSTIIKVESDKRQFGRMIIIDSTGDFRIWLPYSKNYTITFSKKGYQTVPIAVSTVLPENIKKCCFTPFDVSFHLFKPDGIHDSLFNIPIVTIRYEQSLKSYFYSLDMDYYIQKMYIKAEAEHSQRIKDVAYMAKHKDSLALEKKYMKLINSGNLYFSMKQFDMARRMFQKAIELKPKRKYPSYKLEDIETQILIFNKQNENISLNADSVIALAMSDEFENKQKKEYKRKTDEEIEDIFKQDLIKQIQSETKNQKELAQRLQFVKNEVIDKKDFPVVAVVSTQKKDSVSVNEPALIVNTFKPSNDSIIETKPHVATDTIDRSVAPVMDSIIQNKIVTTDSVVPVPQSQIDTTKKIAKPIVVTKPIVKAKPFNKQAYQDSLKKTYPNERTIEIIEEPYKKITRVIINRENIVTIYLKVEHKWGGIFFFIDNTPYALENISKSYFEVSTKLLSEKSNTNTTIKKTESTHQSPKNNKSTLPVQKTTTSSKSLPIKKPATKTPNK